MYKMYWKEVWERKGRAETDDPKELDGFEAVAADPSVFADRIKKILKIKKTDRVLEIGCGAGMISRYLDCHNIGMDYSKSLVKRYSELLKRPVLTAEADSLPFRDKCFDKAFAYSVFHYFPDREYIRRALAEIRRVCKGEIFIGDLPETSHRKEHLLFKRSDFDGEISEGFYNKARFNVLLK